MSVEIPDSSIAVASAHDGRDRADTAHAAGRIDGRTRRRAGAQAANVNIPIQWAPATLYQPILPGWQVSLFSVDLGASSNPEVEKAAIAQVGSYGKQIGHIAEALEVVVEAMKLLDADLAAKKKDALKVFLGDVAAARGVKAQTSG